MKKPRQKYFKLFLIFLVFLGEVFHHRKLKHQIGVKDIDDEPSVSELVRCLTYSKYQIRTFHEKVLSPLISCYTSVSIFSSFKFLNFLSIDQGAFTSMLYVFRRLIFRKYLWNSMADGVFQILLLCTRSKFWQ